MASLALSFLAFSSSAQATTLSGTGTGFSIPDNNVAGALSTITFTDNLPISDITVTLTGLSHTWMGDLIATLTHVDTNTTVSLFNRVGRISTGPGDSSELEGTYRFNDAFTGDLWATAASLGGSGIIPGGDYFATGANSSSEVPILPAFSGDLSGGTWQLTIADGLSGITGSLNSWALEIETPMGAVPEPLTMLGVGTAVGFGAMFKRKLAKVGK